MACVSSVGSQDSMTIRFTPTGMNVDTSRSELPHRSSSVPRLLVQSALQLSVSSRSPSSHCSTPEYVNPSPQTFITQPSTQPSLLDWLPSSQISSMPRKPSPHPGGRQIDEHSSNSSKSASSHA